MTVFNKTWTALERLRAQYYQDEKMEEQVVPGQTRVDEVEAESELSMGPFCNPDMFSEEENIEMEEIQRKMGEVNRLWSALFSKAEERKKQEKLAEEEKKKEALAEMESIISCAENESKKKDVKTISISWVKLEEKLACDEFLDLIAHRLKAKPNGTVPNKSECGRAVFRWLMQNPGKCGIIPDEEVE